jgi:hypothetical protein
LDIDYSYYYTSAHRVATLTRCSGEELAALKPR